MRKSTPKAASPRRWRIIEIRKKGQAIATVDAPDAAAAIGKAIEDYGITEPHRQRRLVAQPVE
jgi:predicted chitinase